jgi:hypothetical protein
MVKPRRFKKEEARMALTDNLRLRSRCFFRISSSSTGIGTAAVWSGANGVVVVLGTAFRRPVVLFMMRLLDDRVEVLAHPTAWGKATRRIYKLQTHQLLLCHFIAATTHPIQYGRLADVPKREE